MFIYDRYGIWKINAECPNTPQLVIGDRKNKRSYRYIRVNPEERFIEPEQNVVFRTFNENNKKSGLWDGQYANKLSIADLTPLNTDDEFSIGQVAKAENANVFIFSKENFNESPDLFIVENLGGKITANLIEW